jgi:hypothetical protein
MTVNSHACVTIECDGGCTDKGWDEGALHFASEQEALEYVLGEDERGWTRRPDGRLLCRSCSEDADCEALGHQWSKWRDHHRDDAIQWRCCEHCRGGFDERLKAMS